MQAFSATAGLELSEMCFLTHDGVVSLKYEQFLFKYCLNIPTHHRDEFFFYRVHYGDSCHGRLAGQNVFMCREIRVGVTPAGYLSVLVVRKGVSKCRLLAPLQAWSFLKGVS